MFGRATPIFLALSLAFSGKSLAADVNFELALGYGTQGEWDVYDLDLRANLPHTDMIGSQLTINSDYFFNGTETQDFAQSLILWRTFLRQDAGRIGIGFGNVKRKLRFGAGLAETYFVEGSAAVYLNDWNLVVDYRDGDEQVGNTIRTRHGFVYYPDVNRSIEFHRVYSNEQESWRLATFVQPIKYRQQTSIGITIEDGPQDDMPRLDLLVTYYFDRAITLKDRQRLFH